MSFLYKINWIHFIHNDLHVQAFWKTFLLQLVIKRSRKIVCNSKTTKINLNKMLRISNKNKIFVNYNGIEFDKIEKLNVKNKFAIFTILFVGRLVKEKSVETLIDAINLIKTKYQYNIIPFEVKIVGDGPYASKLVSKVNNYSLNKQIQFLGLVNRNTVYKIMKKSHCLVSPSKNEGFCNVNIEALACGLKVIASDINIFKEVGKNNFIFFKQGNAISLMEEIYTLYDSFIKKNYNNKTNKEYIKQFTLKKNVEGILNIIKQKL